ncbi:YheU family protein [Pseudomonas aeruginosa]
MLIPHDLLEADTLNNLLEDFVTREGTDNGDETPLDVRVERARHALRRGEAVILFAAHPGNAGQRPRSVGRITARGYPPLIRDIGG